MSDMRTSLILTADASGLKAGVRDAKGEVKSLTETTDQVALAANRARDALGRFSSGATAAKATVAGAGTATAGTAVQVDRYAVATQRAGAATATMAAQLRSSVTSANSVKASLASVSSTATGAAIQVESLAASAQQATRTTGLARNALGQFAAEAVAVRTSVAAAAGATSGATVQTERLTGATQRATAASGSMISQLRNMVVAIGGVLVVAKIIQWADAWKLTEGRLSLVTASSLELKAVQEQLFGVAQRSGQAFSSTATLYGRLAQATKQLGISQQQLIGITETINQAFVVSGSGANESQAAITQLSQAIASGVLRGDEFNSVMEQAPRLQQALTDSLGKTSGELRSMAEQGQLTVQMILQALEQEAPKIGQEFAKMPLTIGRAMVQLGNSLQRLVGLADSASGSSSIIANAISSLAMKLSEPQVVEAVANFAKILATGLALAIDAAVVVSDNIDIVSAAVAGLTALKIASWLQAATIGMKALSLESMIFAATPFGAALVAIGLVTAAVTYFWMENAEAARQEKALADAMQVTDDARRLSGEQVKSLTDLERQLTVEKIKQAVATQEQAVAELQLRRIDAYADLTEVTTSKAKLQALGPGYQAGASDPAIQTRIDFSKSQIAGIDHEIVNLNESMAGAAETLDRLLAGDTGIGGGTGAAGSDTGLADKIQKARAQIDALQQSVLDLGSQKISLDGGGTEGLTITQDAQKARDMLLEFGDAAKLGASDMAGLEQAAGVTAEQIAAWFAEQRQLNLAIDESVDLLAKQAEAPKTFAKYLADLEQQNAELRLEVNGREDLIPLLQAEVQLKEQLGRPITDEERGRLQQLLADQNKLNAAIDQQKEITDAAKRSAEMMQEPFKNALRGIQQAWTDMFRKTIDGNMKSFKDFGRSLLGTFKQLAAEIATLLVFRPVVGGILSSLGMSDLGAQLGLSTGSGGASTGGAGGAGNFLGGLSGNQWNTGIGSMLFGKPGTPPIGGPRPSAGAQGTSGLFGTNGAGWFSGALDSPMGGGAFAGLMAGATTYAAGGTGAESIGAGVGGAAGAALGSYFGQGGSMVGATVGSMLGKLVGGMFNKKESSKKVKNVVGATLQFGGSGDLDVSGAFGYASGKGQQANSTAGGQLGTAMSDAFNDFFFDLGAIFDPSAQAQVQEVYQARVKGKKTEEEKHYFYGSFAGEHVGTSETSEEFLPQFLSGSLAVAAEKGLVSGVSETILAIFKNVFNNNDRVGTTDSDELTRMVEFGKFYDRVDEVRTPAIAAANALSELRKALASAKATADEYGLSVEHVTEVFRANFLDDIEDEILQLTDPQAYDLSELEKEYAARKAVAIELGVDLADVEELYALKRKTIVEGGLSEMADSFRTFFDELTLGDLAVATPTQKLNQAQGRFEGVVASNDNSQFVDAARDYLEVAKGYYGATETYTKIYDEILALTRQLGDIPGFAKGGVAQGLVLVGEEGPELINVGSPSMVINPRMAADYLDRFHLNGDTMLAHINDNEAAILTEAGGANTINPMTGQRQFYNGGNDGGGGGRVGGSHPGAIGGERAASQSAARGGNSNSGGGGAGGGGKVGGSHPGAIGGEHAASQASTRAGENGYGGRESDSADPGPLAKMLGYETMGQLRAAYAANPNAPHNQAPAAMVPNYPFASTSVVIGAIIDGLTSASMLGMLGLGYRAADSAITGGTFSTGFGMDAALAAGGTLGPRAGSIGVGHDAQGRSDAVDTYLAPPANENSVTTINEQIATLFGGGGSSPLAGSSDSTETLRLLTEIRDGQAEGLDALNRTFSDQFSDLTAETRKSRIAEEHINTQRQWSGRMAASRG